MTLDYTLEFKLSFDDNKDTRVMLIGELAKELNTTPYTIRYYEKKGLIQPEFIRDSKYREFGEQTKKRLSFIFRAKQLGFSLHEIKELLEIKVSSKKECLEVKQKSLIKIQEVQQKIQELSQIKKSLEKVVHSCEKNYRIEECPFLNHDK